MTDMTETKAVNYLFDAAALLERPQHPADWSFSDVQLSLQNSLVLSPFRSALALLDGKTLLALTDLHLRALLPDAEPAQRELQALIESAKLQASGMVWPCANSSQRNLLYQFAVCEANGRQANLSVSRSSTGHQSDSEEDECEITYRYFAYRG